MCWDIYKDREQWGEGGREGKYIYCNIEYRPEGLEETGEERRRRFEERTAESAWQGATSF